MTRLLDANSQDGISPEFSVSVAMLDRISPSGDRGGMVIGRGPKNEPLSLSIVRPAPTRVISVGGLYMARQLAMRAMATGAWVFIATARLAAWQVLERAAEQLPMVAYVQNNLGIALERVGRTDEATAAYQQAMDLSPKYVKARVNAARVAKAVIEVDRVEDNEE